MSQGTWASYQGIPCISVVFRRARGAAATLSEVVIPVKSWPTDFAWKLPEASALGRPQAEIPDVTTGLSDERQAALPLPAGLEYEGTLVLAERSDRVFSVPGLLVVRVQTDTRDDETGTAIVRLTLADDRLFAGLGVSPRWRWNTLRPDGSKSLDTFKPTGNAYTLEEVARELASSAWRSPPIGRVPAAWRAASSAREVQFDPFPAASRALERLAQLGGASALSKHLDGAIGIYRANEGKLGYAPNGQGPNTEDIPPEVIADEGGGGTQDVIESNFPPDFVVVVGRERVATVALDDWEPVVMIEGRPFYLSEELVRYLTGGSITVTPQISIIGESFRYSVDGGRHGLEWLRKWVMLPNADLGAEGVDQDVLRLFADQAWKLWRLPGAEKIRDGFYSGETGRNAHLLPMLDRAETRKGSRLPPTVYASSWETKRRNLNATEQQAALSSAAQTISQLQQEITRLLLLRGAGGRDPLEQQATVTGTGAGDNIVARQFTQLEGLTIGDMIGGQEIPPGINVEKLNSRMREFRRIAKLRELDETLAQRYERALLQKVKAQDALSYEEEEATFELAKELVEFERTAAEGATTSGGLRSEYARQFGAQTLNKLRDLARKRALTNRRRQADKEAGRPRGDLLSYVFLRNNIRAADGGARVYAADLGIVQTSQRAGHSERTDVNDPAISAFLPKPVRVFFGAKVRPRVDQPRPSTGPRAPARRPTTGDQDTIATVSQLAGNLATLIGQEVEGAVESASTGDLIPQVLGDEASVYRAAFRRRGREAVPVALEDARLNQALKIARPWTELVPLGELGNKGELDEDARKLAAELFKPTDRTRSRNLVIVGPWPINCDGYVSAVEIRSEQSGGAICGFTTRVAVGGDAVVPDDGGTRTR